MNRGSTWKKWDLHFHTPSSYDYQDKSVSNQQIIDKLVENEISAVAITDHHEIDIERIQELQTLGKGKVAVLPGIEFLSDAKGRQPIHFIGIFSEEANIRHIWGQISNKTNISKITAEGKKHNEVYCHLNDTIRLIKDLGGLVTIHAGEKSNSVENITHSLPHGEAQKTDIARAVDIYELGKASDQDGYKSVVFPHIKKELPLIICSDNHNIDNYAVKENCWIKAKPTFEGLKQIIYEPDRVKIQQENPERSKQAYYLIDKIKFKNSASENLFTEHEIGLNTNLNSIIGGKSSGKSLLLQLIAKSVMPVERFQLLKDTTGFKLPEYDLLKGFDIEVSWRDGTVNRLSKTQEDEHKKPVTYIPQMYLNHMAENKRSDFRELIESILADKYGYREFIEQQDKQIKSVESQISAEISKYFELKTKHSKLKAEIQDIGDIQAIKTNIDTLKKELEELKQQSGLEDSQQQAYQRFIDQKNDLLAQKQKFEAELAFNQVLVNELNELESQINEMVLQKISSLSFEYSDFEIKLNKVKDQFSDGISNTIDHARADASIFDYQKISADIDELDKKMRVIDSSLLPLQQSLKNQELLQSKTRILEQENKKLKQIEAKKEELKRLLEALRSHHINSLYESLLNQYLTISDKLKQYSQVSNTEGKEITLISEVKFNYENFNRDFLNYVNKKRSLENQFQDCGFIENSYDFNIDQHVNNFKKVAQQILAVHSEVSFNQNKPLSEMLSALFKNYFYIDYDLQQGHDRLGQMSPGKKGIILFQLFLHLSSSKWPILIDQPEDNLDNRSVYAELNNFIKEKKLDRQIIMVSHNANLVVSTDSENIIVAHQNGNEPSRTRFEYINGALENTFVSKDDNSHVLEKYGIRQHVCEILEGGIIAFKQREKRYDFS